MTQRLFATVYADNDLPTEEAHIVSKSLGTVDDWTELEYTVHEHGTGLFMGKINRHLASASLLVADRYLLVHSDVGVVGGTFLEAAPIDVSAAEGPGDEWMIWGGRSQVVILERARMDNDSNLAAIGGKDPIKGWWDLSAQGNFAGADSGHPIPMFKRALVEMALNTPSGIDVVDHSSWDYALDTDGNVPAFSDGIYGVAVGDDGLGILREMDMLGGVVFPMSPLFKLDAYLDHGTDRSGAFGAGTVRFEKGVNVATAITRKIRGSVYISHLLVGGANAVYHTVVDPAWVSGDVVRWGFLSMPETDDIGQLDAAGLAHIARRKVQTDAWELPLHDHGNDPANGIYEPAPDIADGHFWVGDRGSLHTGTGAYDANEEVTPIASIKWTLKSGDEANGDYVVSVGIGSTFNWQDAAPWMSPGTGAQTTWLPHKRYDDFARASLGFPGSGSDPHTVASTPQNCGMGNARSGRPWKVFDQNDDSFVQMSGYEAFLTLGPSGHQTIVAYVNDPIGVWVSDDASAGVGPPYPYHAMEFRMSARISASDIDTGGALQRALTFFIGDPAPSGGSGQFSVALFLDDTGGMILTSGSTSEPYTAWLPDDGFLSSSIDFLWDHKPNVYNRVKVWPSIEQEPEAWTLIEAPDASGGPVVERSMGVRYEGEANDTIMWQWVDVIHGEFMHDGATDAVAAAAALAAATSFTSQNKWSLE